MPIEIRPLQDGEDVSCERILRSLPNWFGIESAIVEYVCNLPVMETWVAHDAGEVIGFLAIKTHNLRAAEIEVMAVTAPRHGKGCGRRLVEHAETILCRRGTEYLQVKTLAPSHPDEHYAKTRGFYLQLGFVPLQENQLWGPDNPCLIMVKHLGCGVAADGSPA